MTNNEQHVYNHHEATKPVVSLKTEKNSRGTNWEVSVSGASSVDEAMALMDAACIEMTQRFGAKETA